MFRPPAYLIRVSEVSQLLDVVHQAIQLPLPIHLRAPAQREAGESLVVPQVAEHGLDGGKARGDHPFALGRIDASLHPLGVGFIAIALAAEEGNLSHPGLARRAQAPLALVARHAVALGSGVFGGGIAVDRALAPVAIEALAGRADAVAAVLGFGEVGVGVALVLAGGARVLRLVALVPQRVGLGFVLRLIGVSGVALPVAVVADPGGDAALAMATRRWSISGATCIAA